jgi:hypothetical protein
MEIRDEEIEYGIVIRFRDMLQASSSMSYNVSFTYALFTSVLCWTLQRIRPPKKRPTLPSDLQKHSWELWDKLGTEEVESRPWAIPTASTDSVPGALGPFPAFQKKSFASTLIALRNAVAHGDDRIVKPYNQERELHHRRELAGFIFKCNEKDKNKMIVWEGEITLLERDMRRIAEGIANRFLRDAMKVKPMDEQRTRVLIRSMPERKLAA